MLHIDANRIPVLDAHEQSGFSSTIASLMDQERTRQYSQEGAHFESRYALILTYLPPLQVHRQANALMFDKSAELETRAAVERPFRRIYAHGRAVNGPSCRRLSRCR